MGEALALAKAIGARCRVDIAGSLNPGSWFGPHTDDFSRGFVDASLENPRNISDAVKPRRVVFCYEMMGRAGPVTADQYWKLTRAVNRRGFAVHLDPCNGINSPEKFYDNTALLNESFDSLGKWIASCHARDLAWDVEMNLDFREVVPGAGVLDYETDMRRVAPQPQNPPLMIEPMANDQE